MILTQIVEILENSGISYEISKNSTGISVNFTEHQQIVAETTETSTPTIDYPPKPEGEGWISNQGNNAYCFPDGYGMWVGSNVEAVVRCGVKITETALAFGNLWKETDNAAYDIIWFRIVK